MRLWRRPRQVALSTYGQSATYGEPKKVVTRAETQKVTLFRWCVAELSDFIESFARALAGDLYLCEGKLKCREGCLLCVAAKSNTNHSADTNAWIQYNCSVWTLSPFLTDLRSDLLNIKVWSLKRIFSMCFRLLFNYTSSWMKPTKIAKRSHLNSSVFGRVNP